MERPVSPVETTTSIEEIAVPQWIPTPEEIAEARVTDFARYVALSRGVHTDGYHQLWEWSVADIAGFWRSVWEYFDLGDHTGEVLTDATMPGARWFPGVRLNYVDRVISQAQPDRPAILALSEGRPMRELSWREMLSRTAVLARSLSDLGVRPGDRVVGYLPNIPEAVIAFLATASIGAVWSACGQDYTAKAALDRLGQLDPVVLIAADGYRYGGREHDRRDEIATLRAGLPGLRATVVVPVLGAAAATAPSPRGAGADDPVRAWDECTTSVDPVEPVTVPVDFEHPLWVLFSSGTTGKPKGIVHGHGGVLLEHLKAVALQSDIGSEDTFFWYTSPSWMMWNFQVAGLLVGATIVCYDGSPAHPGPDGLWELASRTRATVLGTSPGYVLGCEKVGAVPAEDHDLAALRLIGITGSALPPSSSLWLRDKVGAHIPVASISGGTDVVSAFLGGVRTVPVWPGELSAPYLGVALEAWDGHGRAVRGAVGELVITRPMPSMPVGFWNDPDGTRYRAAYFDMFPGVWRHGDWITRTAHGSVIVHGRSDSTLNRNGIRMGSADIYQVVEAMPEVAEALVLGIEESDGGYWMPLFVVSAPGVDLTDAVVARIRATIRTELSPRHVPDEIIAAPGIPHTRTGKKLEVPLKRLLQGADPAGVVDPAAVDEPELLAWYAARRR
ncbi:acetoacetate--CoA ligase [Nocardia sp. 2]|uniref:Acetoacetate--CoA ligase n=1 Tax=Nocardia acididurans TaxID=2802282 RepID=A0ABS1M572_9NOCA|nr:acetoacetate--CoA ligase [Nocardia acididurans]MBL1074288.1 acetoacetate--CoA ligase [Nocardia acididurans]